jgi:hypothetical protein
MTLACKWVETGRARGKLVMRWATKDMSEGRKGDSDHNATW